MSDERLLRVWMKIHEQRDALVAFGTVILCEIGTLIWLLRIT